MKRHRLPIITAALWLLVGIMLGIALMSTGCGGEIDPAGAVRAESASGTWSVEHRRGG